MKSQALCQRTKYPGPPLFLNSGAMHAWGKALENGSTTQLYAECTGIRYLQFLEFLLNGHAYKAHAKIQNICTSVWCVLKSYGRELSRRNYFANYILKVVYYIFNCFWMLSWEKTKTNTLDIWENYSNIFWRQRLHRRLTWGIEGTARRGRRRGCSKCCFKIGLQYISLSWCDGGRWWRWSNKRTSKAFLKN